MIELFNLGRVQKILNSAFLMLISFCINAQNSDFEVGDKNYTLTLAFHRVDTLLVVFPNNYEISDQEKQTIENYVFWEQYQKKPVYVYKKENSLTTKDEARHLQFYGPFFDFKITEIQNIPIKQISGGFWFNNEAFTHATDAFFYLNNDANRLYTCQNSSKEMNQTINYAAGYYQFYIFRGDDIHLSGSCSSKTGKSQLNYIAEMRKMYFESIETKHFNFQLAKNLYSDSVSQVISTEADLFLETLCTALQTDTIGLEKMTTYVYKNMDDLRKFLSMSPLMTIYGKSIGSINHVSSFDMTVFKHETAHSIINQKIGAQANSFFCEGFATYTGYLIDDIGYKNDFDSTRIHLDLLSKDVIFRDNRSFYSLPILYPISGVFTRFVVKKMGIELFKDVYAQKNIEIAFQEKGFSLESLITEFKNSLTKTISAD